MTNMPSKVTIFDRPELLIGGCSAAFVLVLEAWSNAMKGVSLIVFGASSTVAIIVAGTCRAVSLRVPRFFGLITAALLTFLFVVTSVCFARGYGAVMSCSLMGLIWIGYIVSGILCCKNDSIKF